MLSAGVPAADHTDRGDPARSSPASRELVGGGFDPSRVSDPLYFDPTCPRAFRAHLMRTCTRRCHRAPLGSSADIQAPSAPPCRCASARGPSSRADAAASAGGPHQLARRRDRERGHEAQQGGDFVCGGETAGRRRADRSSRASASGPCAAIAGIGESTTSAENQRPRVIGLFLARTSDMRTRGSALRTASTSSG